MSRNKTGYRALVYDDGFTNLSLNKLRWLVGLGLAEMAGTATFLAMGCSTMAYPAAHVNLFLIVLSLSTGISTAIMMVNHISGSIMNPALNLTCVMLGHMSILRCIFYTVFQLLGGLLGAGVVKLLSWQRSVECVSHIPAGSDWMKGLTAEILATFVLAFVFCTLFDKRQAPNEAFIAFKFGIVVFSLAIPIAQYSSASLNPARSFGPAFVNWIWKDHWIFWVGPYIGAALGAVFYRLFFAYSITQKVTGEIQAQSA